MNPIVVCKFGGSSVARASNWQHIARIVNTHLSRGRNCLMVVSAVKSVSDLLESMVEHALQDQEAADDQEAAEGQVARALQQLTQIHADLIQQLGISLNIAGEIEEIRHILRDIALQRNDSPLLRARVMAYGEILASRIGAGFLSACEWLDVRRILVSQASESPDANRPREYLSASCAVQTDPSLASRIFGPMTRLVITQGFIASNDQGETVLLGRGGSDTTAAYLGVALGAEAVEIWSDVPGLFSANPAEVLDARLLTHLSYREAQELAFCGAKALHPRAIEPLAIHQIPLLLKCVFAPDKKGTVIDSKSSQDEDFGGIKAVISKRGIYLITMESLGMWQQVGFLAAVFSVFKQHGLSIDVITTSQSNVTVSLDSIDNVLSEGRIGHVLAELKPYCHAHAIGPCSSISLVGRAIRYHMAQLGAILASFSDQKVLLMSHAASDLNFTIMIEDAHTTMMVKRLHEQLFPHPPKASHENRKPLWWQNSPAQEELLAISQKKSHGDPCYVYHLPTVRQQLEKLCTLVPSVARWNYAMKANSHPAILKTVAAQGWSFDCVSIYELRRLLEAVPQLPKSRIVFTPNFAPVREYREALECGALLTLDNVSLLQELKDHLRGNQVMIRLDPPVGRGHHHHVRTAGPQSKFGIPAHELADIAAWCEQHQVTIAGIHCHVGSGIFDPQAWSDAANFLQNELKCVPKARILDIGGGLGVSDRAGTETLDLGLLEANLGQFVKQNPQVELWMEPGRYIVADAGILLATVTQCKHKGTRTFLGINAGMNALIRPALYDAYHEIINLSRVHEPNDTLYDVVGPICESGDIVGRDRWLPRCEVGDIIAIAQCGAYGRVMASTYNLRPIPEEWILE